MKGSNYSRGNDGCHDGLGHAVKLSVYWGKGDGTRESEAAVDVASVGKGGATVWAWEGSGATIVMCSGEGKGDPTGGGGGEGSEGEKEQRDKAAKSFFLERIIVVVIGEGDSR